MLCPHCGLTNLHHDGRIERCAICGYWNDPLYPLRAANTQDNYELMEMERMKQGLQVKLRKVRADKFRTPDENREYHRVYNKKYYAEFKERIKEQKRLARLRCQTT